MGEQFLYHWKTFPIILPPTAITTKCQINGNDSTYGPGEYYFNYFNYHYING